LLSVLFILWNISLINFFFVTINETGKCNEVNLEIL
jgi:hypothetical protein